MAATLTNATAALNIGGGGTIVTGAATDNVNGNYFIQDGKTILRLVNTDASSRTVTFTYPLLVDGNTVPSKVLTLAANEVRYVACGLRSDDRNLYPSGIITFTSNNALVKYELITYFS